MKIRILAAVLLAIVALFAVGCANEDPLPDNHTTGSGSEELSTPEAETGGEPEDSLEIDGSSQAKDERPEPGELPDRLSYRQTAGERALMQADFNKPDSASTKP